MAEDVKNTSTGTGTETTQENRTFTQDELNAIVQDRLNREREKYADYDTLKDKAAKFDEAEEANKSELQKAQEKAATLEAAIEKIKKDQAVQAARTKIAAEKNVPVILLTGDTEEACTAQAEEILKYLNPDTGYPSVKDSGEKQFSQSKKSTRDQFAELFNKI